MWNPITASILITFFWGFPPIVHRYVTQSVSKGFIMLISACVYFIAVLIYVLFFQYKDVSFDFKNNKRFILILTMTSFLGLFVANLLYLYIMKNAKNVNVVIVIMAMYPAISLLLAVLFLKEKLDLLGMIGFFVILTGLSILLYSNNK